MLATTIATTIRTDRNRISKRLALGAEVLAAQGERSLLDVWEGAYREAFEAGKGGDKGAARAAKVMAGYSDSNAKRLLSECSTVYAMMCATADDPAKRHASGRVGHELACSREGGTGTEARCERRHEDGSA